MTIQQEFARAARIAENRVFKAHPLSMADKAPQPPKRSRAGGDAKRGRPRLC